MDRDKQTPDDKAREPQAPANTPDTPQAAAETPKDGAAETAKADDERGAVRRGPMADYRRHKLHVTDWLDDIPGGMARSEIVEVQFKNTRKGYYRNTTNLPLGPGDVVAVEASPGHDIGTVTVTGALAELRMRKAAGRNTPEPKRVFRLAKPSDIEKYEEARAREDDTMIRARKIAESLKLNMKIGDVEYQGDGNKAIFYYISDERVDFRQLIKILAETFKVRIEMKQIGARQEAGRIGGIGPCGRPLCCSVWMSNFVSVATSAARHQDISLNPQKLAGQCAKLKCCLNFEVDAYVEAGRKMPPREVRLETADATYYHFKSDIFNRLVTYSTDKSMAANLVTISAERVFEVIAMNKAGEKPLTLMSEGEQKPKEKPAFGDILGDDDLTRFDRKKKRKKKGGNGGGQPAKDNFPKDGQPKDNGPKEGQPRDNRGKDGAKRKQRGPRPDGERGQQQGERQAGGQRPDGERQQGERQAGGEKPQGERQPRNKRRGPKAQDGAPKGDNAKAPDGSPKAPDGNSKPGNGASKPMEGTPKPSGGNEAQQ